MARHASAKKAAKQSLKRRSRNLQTTGVLKSVVKNMRTALGAKYATKEEAKKTLVPMLQKTSSTLMRAVSKNVLKAGNASRRISRLASQVHKAIT